MARGGDELTARVARLERDVAELKRMLDDDHVGARERVRREEERMRRSVHETEALVHRAEEQVDALERSTHDVEASVDEARRRTGRGDSGGSTD